MNIDLEIDHLVLEGLPISAADGSAVRAAIEAELVQLLAGGDLAHLSGAWASRVSAPAVDLSLAGHETPAALGRAIGGAIHGGISR